MKEIKWLQNKFNYLRLNLITNFIKHQFNH
jgi:hypothetical protein